MSARHLTRKELTAIGDEVEAMFARGCTVEEVHNFIDPDHVGRGKRLMQRIIDEENRRADLRLVTDEESD
jgi:hypothetical protein